MKASIEIVKRNGDFLIMPGSHVDPSAHLTGGSSIAPGTQIAAGAHIQSSIIESDCSIGKDAQIINSFISRGTKVAAGVKIESSYVTNQEIVSIP
jgi:NDP-sugar pyrophosphorylase family protein